ncbi:uncharacterized protein LOC110845987 isoform X2 [Folsomia candida]|uniref:uncharacterized protein LOC110845987 isoform X2 n=1 Tax=Folsomia candida TaxID=158441 RepID=UPI000B90788E|nr:uncharacterized protein LOC110845987 isoform X2 [Folsomia candida]
MDLCPAPKPQAYEMLWCANKCGKLNGSSSPPTSGTSSSGSSPDVISQPYLSFGDYSVFASEMKRAYHEPESKGSQTTMAPASKIPHKNNDQRLPSASDFINKCNDKSSLDCQVFLGGACNPTTWRQDIALPMLKDMDITFFNPQVTNWEPRLIELEHHAKENADVLFYVIDNQTRGIVVMIEVAYLVAKQRNVVLVINGFKEPGQRICNEPLSKIEYEDLTFSQMVLQDLIDIHGTPVFHNDIPTALNSTAKIIKDKIRPQDFKLSDLAQPVKKGILHLGNKLINLKKTFENLDSKSSGEISLSHVLMAYQILANGELTKDAVHNVLDRLKRTDDDLIVTQTTPSSETNETTISGKKEVNGVNINTLNFDQFCCIMSELLLHHYYNSARSLSTLLSTNKTNFFVQSVSVALTKLLEHVPPSSKTGWLPLLSKQESVDVITHSTTYDVYLGGDCSEEDWRSLAIPILRENDLTYFNPEVNCSKNRHILVDKASIDGCRVILFNIPSASRSIEFMTMAAYYFGKGCHVVLCVGYLQDECQIKEEKLTKVAVKDYNRGRAYLTDMACKDGVPVFDNITDALNCVVEKCKTLKTSSN